MASATVDPEAHPLSPAILPFAVRTPYLNVWHALVAGDLSPDTHETATSYGDDVARVGWDGLVAVDGTFYVWLSDFEVAAWTRNASVKQTQVTPTRTILTITTGPVELTVTFLSPIEPGNWVRQSIPFTYVAVDVNSLDGATHSVQLYSAIGGEWNSADWGQNITWQTTRTPYSIYHSSTLLNPTPYKEDSMALWGSVHYAIKKDSSVTAMTGLGPTVQGVFEGNRELDNSQDTQFRQIGTFSRFALAQDLGAITKTQNPVVWALGANRDPAILYTDISGQGQPRSFYFNSNSTLSASTDALVDDVLADYPNALTRATQLDQRILSAANSISSNYADLVSQATRQAFGATELTIAKGSDGSWNTSDVMMFMKGFGGSVDTNRVNAVETLYASFPVFMFVDPTLGAPLLEPLLRFQTSDFYTNDYAAKDLGSDYPKATGNNTSHSYGVEHTSSMIIMAYAHARTTGDGSLLKRYYTLLRKWADYLTANSMPIKDQLSADDDSFDSQTNLAIKGIIAVEAMSRISTALDEKDDAVNYDSQAKSLLSQWKATALGSDNHLLASLGAANSYTLGYNLFADQWLGTGLIDSSIIDAHTKFLGNMMTAGPNTSYGVANDNYNVTFTANSAWNMFAAATVSDGKVRDQLIAGIHQAASYTPNSSIAAFPLIYNSVNGSVISGSGSPAQGAMFAPIALSVPVVAISTMAPSTGHHGLAVGAIVGIVIGAVASLLAILSAILLFLRRRRRRRFENRFRETIIPDSDSEMAQFAVGNAFRMEDNAEYRPELSMPSTTVTSLNLGTSAGSHSASGGVEEEQLIVVQAPEPVSDKSLARMRAMNAAGPHDASMSDAQGLDAEQLRMEIMDNLRQEIHQTLAEQWAAPPGYVDGRQHEPSQP